MTIAARRPIRKAVFPVAGLGSRFLPATKVLPKEMLPIVDKPLIQYAVEEAIAAGIEHIIFITASCQTRDRGSFRSSARAPVAARYQRKERIAARDRAQRCADPFTARCGRPSHSA